MTCRCASGSSRSSTDAGRVYRKVNNIKTCWNPLPALATSSGLPLRLLLYSEIISQESVLICALYWANINLFCTIRNEFHSDSPFTCATDFDFNRAPEDSF